MANCLKCKHMQIYDKDLAIALLAADDDTRIKYKCSETNPHIKNLTLTNIKAGYCPKFRRRGDSLIES